MLAEHERTFEAFGSHVRILIGAPVRDGAPSPAIAALGIEALIRRVHATLTRFDPCSELSRLNADPSAVVDAGPFLVDLVALAIEAGGSSGGLVDATTLTALETCGYAHSRVDREPASLAEALGKAPARRPALPARPPSWKRLSFDREAGLVIRPPGVRIDGGGLAKGMAADLAAARLIGHSSFAVDCGGDLRIGGANGLPRRVAVEHPLNPGSGEAASFDVVDGGVATSGLRSRIWRQGEGFSHHLIDPGRARPAWTGLIQVTALAHTAAEAEVIAKAAMLEGPDGARRRLAPCGGVMIHDSGEVEICGSPAQAVTAEPAAAA